MFYENLANAIVEKAVDDYISLVKKIDATIQKKYYMSNEKFENKIKALYYQFKAEEKFFGSAWYGVLTKVDGDYMLKRVKDMIYERHGINVDKMIDFVTKLVVL